MSLLILFKTLTGFFRLKNTGKSRGFALFFPALILLSSCGLPSYSYLFPPTDVYSRDDPSSSSNGQDLIFSNAYKNNLSIFTGYEIYYKIYDPLDSSTSESEYSSDLTTITNTTAADYNTFAGLGFYRLFFTTGEPTSDAFIHDSSKPAFEPDTDLLDVDYQIRFNFNQSLVDSYYASTYNTTVYSFSSTPNIYRYVYDSDTGTSSYTVKRFSADSFDIYDNDMPETVTSADMVNADDYYVYITFYIMSFGRDADDITSSVYSEPVYLGTIKFNCTLTDDFFD